MVATIVATSTTALARDALAHISEGIVVITMLATLLVYRAARRERGFASTARAILRWVWLGLLGWALEPAALYFGRGPYFTINAVVAVSFFVAGRAMLGAEQRLHRLLRPEPAPHAGDRTRSWTVLRALVRPRAAAVVAGCVGMAAVLGSIALDADGMSSADLDVADLPSAIVSALGMIVLGLGLYRELTRERRELVGTACGLAVIVYGCLQPLRVIEPARTWLLFVSILLKVAFLLAIASFWTLVREMARAQGEEAQRWRKSVQDASRKAQAVADLHDIVLGGLHSIRMLTGLARREAVAGSPCAATLSQVEAQVGTCSEAVRSVIDGLPALELARGGLRATLQELLQSLRARSQLRAELSWDFDGELPSSVARALAAIAIEAAHNVEQHADAQRLHIAVRGRDERLTLVVEDDGVGPGIGPASGVGYGLRNMRTRAESIGAAFRFEPGSAGGARVVVELAEVAP